MSTPIGHSDIVDHGRALCNTLGSKWIQFSQLIISQMQIQWLSVAVAQGGLLKFNLLEQMSGCGSKLPWRILEKLEFDEHRLAVVESMSYQVKVHSLKR